jgi:hypothetical protein
MYRANAAIPPAQLARRVEVPSGFSLFAGDIVRPPRAWLERTANALPSPPAEGTSRRSRSPRSTRRSCAPSSAPTDRQRRAEAAAREWRLSPRRSSGSLRQSSGRSSRVHPTQERQLSVLKDLVSARDEKHRSDGYECARNADYAYDSGDTIPRCPRRHVAS